MLELRGATNAAQCIEWAVQALVDGHESQSLRSLAGLDLEGPPSSFIAAEKFRVAVQELQLQVPDQAELFRLYAQEMARSIVEGKVDPKSAVDQIHREALSPFNHPEDLMPWCYLWEGLNPDDFSSLEGESLDQAIVETARAWA